ncbi:MAG: TIGR04086 family membrane protein [Clostridiales bacterium]|nr:TIGR04086 family membrane protein [Clostridiales bacterium]
MDKTNKPAKVEEKAGKNEYLLYLLTIAKATGIAIVLTLVLILISAVVLLMSGIDDSASAYIVEAIRIVSIAFAGILCGRSVPKLGWLSGMAAGLLYLLVTVVVGLISYGSIGTGGKLLIDLAVCAVTGLSAGVIGINSAKKKKKAY